MAATKSNKTKEQYPAKKAVTGTTPAQPAPRLQVWPALACAAFAFLLYAATIGSGYVLDDNVVITSNPIVQKGIKGIPEAFSADMWHFYNVNLGYYRPVSIITFAIEHQFFGNNPHVSHFGNVLLYTLTAFFLCLLLLRVFRAYHPVFAVAITLIFIAHPIHTEVVCNIKSRDEMLAFLNLILCMYCLFKALKPGGISYKWFALSGLFYYVALLCKEGAMAGIFLIPLLLFFARVPVLNPQQPKAPALPLSLSKIALYTGVFALLIFFFEVQKQAMTGGTITEVTDIVNYPYAIADVKLPSMFLIFLWCIRLALLPYPLAYTYAYNQIPAAEWLSPWWIVGLVLAVALAYGSIRYIKVRSVIALGVLIFGIMLAPAMGFVLLKGGILAERFLYAPVLGFAIAIAALLAVLFKLDIKTQAPLALSVTKNSLPLIAVILLLSVYSFITITRSTCWKSNYTLFSHDAAVATNSCQAHFLYGDEWLLMANASHDSSQRAGYFSKALVELRKALQIHPDYAEASFSIGVGYHQIALNADSAEIYYKRAIRSSPQYALAWNNLGNLYENTGRQRLASYYYNMAVACNPYYTDAVNNHKRHKAAYGFDVKRMGN